MPLPSAHLFLIDLYMNIPAELQTSCCYPRELVWEERSTVMVKQPMQLFSHLAFIASAGLRCSAIDNLRFGQMAGCPVLLIYHPTCYIFNLDVLPSHMGGSCMFLNRGNLGAMADTGVDDQ